MNWKEFFHPTRKNVIFAIIIFVIISFIPIIPSYCSYFCQGCQGVEYRPLIASCKFIPTTYLIILIEIIVSYTLSCWLVRLFRKK